MNNRNNPCACGSGKKTKRCCGDEAKLCIQRRCEREAKYWDFLARRQRFIEEFMKTMPVKEGV